MPTVFLDPTFLHRPPKQVNRTQLRACLRAISGTKIDDIWLEWVGKITPRMTVDVLPVGYTVPREHHTPVIELAAANRFGVRDPDRTGTI